MATDFAGRVALVTGSGRGIGAAIATALAARGAALMLHERTADETVVRFTEDLASEYGVATAVVAADLLQPGSVGAIFQALDARYGRVDLLINNAGFETTSAAESTEESDWRAVLEVNLSAPFMIAQQAARRMQGRGGVIVNITSIHASVPRKGLASYCAAKAGLAMLTKCLALEWAEYGIRVVGLAPGAVETDMNREVIERFGRHRFDDWIPTGRIGTVADVAEAVAFLCSEAASYVTGTELTLDGGYTLNLVRYDDRPSRQS